MRRWRLNGAAQGGTKPRSIVTLPPPLTQLAYSHRHGCRAITAVIFNPTIDRRSAVTCHFLTANSSPQRAVEESNASIRRPGGRFPGSPDKEAASRTPNRTETLSRGCRSLTSGTQGNRGTDGAPCHGCTPLKAFPGREGRAELCCLRSKGGFSCLSQQLFGAASCLTS